MKKRQREEKRKTRVTSGKDGMENQQKGAKKPDHHVTESCVHFYTHVCLRSFKSFFSCLILKSDLPDTEDGVLFLTKEKLNSRVSAEMHLPRNKKRMFFIITTITAG